VKYAFKKPETPCVLGTEPRPDKLSAAATVEEEEREAQRVHNVHTNQHVSENQGQNFSSTGDEEAT